jgi:AraC-like DNA-binding protein
MLEQWNEAIVTRIDIALYVAPGTGKATHTNRPFHGFVINDGTASKIIHFSDGTQLHNGPWEFHYLPKGSSYRVESIALGGCWAINFDLLEDVVEPPFSLRFRNYESIVKIFKDATTAWKEKSDSGNPAIRRAVYDLIVRIKEEQQRGYMPGQKERLIQPALELIAGEYTRNDLSVQALAELCGISEVYFRRIFQEKFSTSPKTYLIQLRMEYAKKLLQSDQLPVNRVAELCGYYEPCHFSREFFRYTGISPKAYSRMNKTGG